jgi:Enoyl-CoA hydratase/isomerase
LIPEISFSRSLRNKWKTGPDNEDLHSALSLASSHNEHYGSSWGVREVLMKIAFIGATQFLVTIGIALGRDDPPPSSVRPWAPPSLPRYEGDLRQYQPSAAERRYLPAIDPRKTYNLAELIDIAQRSNPEARVAWERARMAAAAVGLTESAYYPYIVGAAAGEYDRAFIPFSQLRADLTKPPTNGNLPTVDIVGGGGTQCLPRLVGRGRALQLILSGEMISAQEAYRIGLVHEVVPASDFSMPAEYAEATKIVFPPSHWEPDNSFMNCFCDGSQ